MASASTSAMSAATPPYTNVWTVAVCVMRWSKRTNLRFLSVRLSSEKPRPHALANAHCSTTTIGRKNDRDVTNRHQPSGGQRQRQRDAQRAPPHAGAQRGGGVVHLGRDQVERRAREDEDVRIRVGGD